MRARISVGALAERLYPALESGVDIAGRTLYLVGEVSEQSVGRLLVALGVLGETEGPIRLVVSSGGGDVDAGMALYDAIRTNRNPVVVEGFGVVQSMAMVLLQAGTERLLSPECRVMMHPGSGEIKGSPRGLQQVANEVALLHDRYVAIISERSGLPREEAERLCGEETFMSAEDAVRAGLADGILKTYNHRQRRKR